MYVCYSSGAMWFYCMSVYLYASGAIPAYDPDTQESLQLYVGIIDVLQSYDTCVYICVLQ